MRLKNKIILCGSLVLSCLVFQVGCVGTQVRFPSSTDEIYSYGHLKQGLLMAAQNNVLFYIPDETLFEVEKTEIDARCSESQKPFWSEKMSVYLSMMQSNPEWFSRFHVLEIKKGDIPKASLENDLDGATVLSIQYGKTENRGKVTLKTSMPCESGKLAEYLDKDIIKIQYEFPSNNEIKTVLKNAKHRKAVKRFEFSNQFISYLAERGFILKFNHGISFEKNAQNKFVFAEVQNRLSKEVKKNKNNKYVSLWMKILNDIRKTEDIIQMFSVENHTDLKAGVKFSYSSKNDQLESSYPYLYMSYNVNNESIKLSSLDDLDRCLANIPNGSTTEFIRKPSSVALNDNKNIKDYSCLSAGLAEDEAL